MSWCIRPGIFPINPSYCTTDTLRSMGWSHTIPRSRSIEDTCTGVHMVIRDDDKWANKINIVITMILLVTPAKDSIPTSLGVVLLIHTIFYALSNQIIHGFTVQNIGHGSWCIIDYPSHFLPFWNGNIIKNENNILFTVFNSMPLPLPFPDFHSHFDSNSMPFPIAVMKVVHESKSGKYTDNPEYTPIYYQKRHIWAGLTKACNF